MPWMSDTTAMIDVTATMLPSTVRNDRSLLLQIALSAITGGFEELVHRSSTFVFRPGVAAGRRPRRPSRAGRRRVSSRTELNGPMMTLVALLQARRATSKYFSPAMPVLTGVKTALPSLDDEHALELLAASGRA